MGLYTVYWAGAGLENLNVTKQNIWETIKPYTKTTKIFKKETTHSNLNFDLTDMVQQKLLPSSVLTYMQKKTAYNKTG